MLSNSKFVYIALTIILFIALNFFTVGSYLQIPFSFVGDPIVYWGMNTGSTIKQVFEGIAKYKSVNEELIKTKSLLGQYEAYKIDNTLLIEENLKLQTQLLIEMPNLKLLEAEVLSDGRLETNDYIIINKGKFDGVTSNSIGVIGEYYVGMIESGLDNRHSQLLLINNAQSFLSVFIVPKDLVEKNITKINSVKAEILQNPIKGVLTGDISGARVENIANSANISIGDYVVVNDEQVGRFLIAGIVENIVDINTSATKNVIVKPIINSGDLRYVFVEIK